MVNQNEFDIYGKFKIYGLSTEEKPTNVKNGTLFIEVNTKKLYCFYENQWYELVEHLNLQTKSVTITENKETTINADSGYEGLDKVNVTTNVQPDLQTKSVTITENGTQTITADEGKDGLSSVSVTTNVSSDLTDYFTSSINNNGIINMIKQIPANTTVSGKNLSNAFANCTNLTSVPQLDISSVTNMSGCFTGCVSLTSIPLLDTSSVTNMNGCFQSCTHLTSIPQLNTSSVTDMSVMFRFAQQLVTLPQLNTSKVTNFTNTFNFCNALSNDSLNNILAMCINATSYTGTKTLKQLGLSSSQATTCQGLSNYQDFITAGWTTGY